MSGAILAIGLLVFLAHLFVAIFQRTRIPDVLLLMAMGLLIGPGLHLVSPDDFGKVGNLMSTLALVVILFESGISIDPDALGDALRLTLRLTLPTFLATGVCAYLVAVYGLGLPPLVGGIAGSILGGVSVAVAIPLVKSLQIPDPLGIAITMEAALGDVLCIVILLGLVQAAASGQVAPVKIISSVVASLIVAVLIGLAGGVAWLLVLNKVRQFPNTAFTTLAVVFILYGIADELGFSGAITALAFGAALTNHDRLAWTGFQIFTDPRLGQLESDDVSFFMEVLFLLKTFFFVYLGVSIQFTHQTPLLWALIFCAAIYAVRPVVVWAASRGFTTPWRDLAVASVMVPKGLVSAVLAGIPVQAGVPGAEIIRELTYTVVLVSITITAVLIPLVDRPPLAGIYRWLYGARTLAPAASKAS